MKHKKTSSSFGIFKLWRPAVALAMVLGITAAIAGQEPVTEEEHLIGYVRWIKQYPERYHLEWLYLEDTVDREPGQRILVRSGKELEFTPGRLYHGRSGLDDILISGWIPGKSYFTRAPHVWAIGAFRKGFHDPAVLVIEALNFNRLRDSDQAVFEAEVDREAGIMDPYPRINAGFSLDMVKEIWIDGDTAERYNRLTSHPETSLPPREKILREAVMRLRKDNRLIVFPNLRHKILDAKTFYPAAYEIVGAYFVGRGLTKSIPRFRPRKEVWK